mgnify:FL=1
MWWMNGAFYSSDLCTQNLVNQVRDLSPGSSALAWSQYLEEHLMNPSGDEI